MRDCARLRGFDCVARGRESPRLTRSCDPGATSSRRSRCSFVQAQGRSRRRDRPDHARRVRGVELRRRPLSRARGNRDKPHLCAGFALK